MLVPVLAPDDSSSQPSCVVSSSRDVSREGPFAVSDTPSDTGVLPLVTNMLRGCPYRMTSYEPMNLADVDPVYGLQLTHPRFLEFLGVPESARLLNGSPGHLVRTMDREDVVFPSAMMDVLSLVRRCAGAPRAAGRSLHVGYGALAASGWSGCSCAVAGFVMQ